jgi:hypothetical protein
VRNKNKELVFEDTADFRPNMTPKEILQAGSFGGTYFRPIQSSVTGKAFTKGDDDMIMLMMSPMI